MIQLFELTSPELIFPGLVSTERQEVLRELASGMEARGQVADAEELLEKLLEREELGSTGIGGGVAIPHCKLAGLSRVLVAIGVASHGVDFGAVDGNPVRVFFLVVSPAKSPAAHLQSLAAISKWVKRDDHVQRILALGDAEEIYALVAEASGSLP